MSSSGSSRISIPKNTKKVIQNIKEIAGNHSDDEIYAMLRECNMDPNETAQKLLLQDPFHEVRRKRDKKKEIPNNRDISDFRRRPGTQGRGSRGGRGNFSPRHIPHDAGVGWNPSSGKENGVDQDKDRSSTPSLPASQEIDTKATAPGSSFVTSAANGHADRGFSRERALQLSSGSGENPPRESLAVTANKFGTVPPSPPLDVLGTLGQPAPNSDHFSASPASVSGVYSSADPVLVPSSEPRTSGSVGTIQREVGSQRAMRESNTIAERKPTVSRDSANRVPVNKIVSHGVTSSNSSSSNATTEVGNPFMHSKMQSKSQGVEKSQLSELSRPNSSSHGGSSTSRPSSNYGSRSQQLTGSQKVGPSKEWKPKSTTPHPAPPQSSAPSSEVPPVADEADAPSLTTSNASASDSATLKLQKKLEELHFLDGQHVIIPNHLHVPESERTGLSFGSFDASFGFGTRYASGPDNDKSSTPLSESSQGVEETAEEPSSSNQSVSQTVHEGDAPDNPQSPKNVSENVSAGEADVPSNSMPEYDSSKAEVTVPPGAHQYSVVHTAPHYSNFGFVSPMLGTHFPPFDSSDAQSRDVSRLQNIFVQPIDPAASYYTQFYRPGVDADARFSPSIAPGTVVKYNGNMAVSSIQCGQSPQEGANSVVLSTAGPTPLVTQAAGVMQSSIPMTPQPVPLYRHPAGVHIPHYPHGYFPYSQFFPPYFAPPPNIHPFLGNTAFSQQAPAGNIYHAPTATTTTGVKPSLSQYKPGTNAGNSTHNGLPIGYGAYGSSTGGYSPTSASTTGNSAGKEDLAASQYKENNVYPTGQQSEGSAGWIPAVGRDISGLQASSFYNLPQGQQMTYAPPQAAHGAFPAIYHPAQTVQTAPVHPLLQQSQAVAGQVEMTGPTAGVYQQPQRTPMNWSNNY